MQKTRSGICEWVFPVQGPEAIEWAGRLGFDGIQIAECGGYEADFPLLRPGVQESYYAARQESGVALQALHLWSLCRMACMIHPMQSAAGKIGLLCLEKGIEACAAMHIPSLMVTSGFFCQIKNEQDLDIFGQYLRWACERGKEEGVQIVFESALTPSQLQTLFQQTDNALKICYDLFNPIRFHCGEPLEEIPQLGLSHIDHIHVKDGPENMIGCTLLSEGCGRFSDVMALLSRMDYNGWFVSENYYLAPPISDHNTFDDAARKDLATLRKFGSN